MSARVFLVEDDAGYARALARHLERQGHEVTACATAEEARRRVGQAAPEVVVLDYQLPDADGLSLLDELRASAPGAVFLVNTAYPDLDVAVEAMRRGAFDFVAKDAEMRECLLRVERAAEVARLRRRAAEAASPTSGGDGELIGESPAMKRLHARLDALAASDDTTAFIVGETGTGKGVIARLIHARSGRAFEPFVAVDCTTIPATLVESELFGHEKGAFSGATHSKLGRVEAAARGTLFLDEIGELELPMQAKLLRLLEEREFTRIGSTRPRRLSARVIAATNRDLARAVSEGRFRADLRYRLEVFVVEVPPLRERGDDVILLAEHFAARRARALGRAAPRFHDALLRALTSYPFPGNVRELRNMIDQAVLLARGDELTLEEFPVLGRAAAGWDPPRPPAPSIRAPAPGGLAAIRQRAAATEREQLVRALEQHGGNVAAAARALRLSRYQVLRRIAKYGLR
ncbi:MAG TPA: sigma-54 dependent transcriptional regulator [Sandaracinaceae bacterium]